MSDGSNARGIISTAVKSGISEASANEAALVGLANQEKVVKVNK